MSGRIPKDLRPIIRAAVAQGWELDHSGRHPRLRRGSDGLVVFFPRSPSDWRAIKNLRAELRRYGVEL